MNDCMAHVGNDRWGATALVVILAVVSSAIVSGRTARAQSPVFRASTQQIAIHASVRDRTGRFVPGLDAQDFIVQVDGTPAPIVLFDRTPQPLRIGLLIELAMENRAARKVELAHALVDALGPADEAVIGTYGQEIAIGPRLTGEHALLHRILADEVWPRKEQGAPLGTAAARVLRFLDGTKGRRAVIAIGQAIDACTSIAFAGCVPPDQLQQEILGNDALLIIARPPFTTYSDHEKVLRLSSEYPRQDTERWLRIRGLLSATGGLDLFVSDHEDAGEWMRGLLQSLRERYLLAVESPVADAREHKIEVRTRSSDLRVTARTRFIAGGGGP